MKRLGVIMGSCAAAGDMNSVGNEYIADKSTKVEDLRPVLPGRRRLYLCRHGETYANASSTVQVK